MKNRKTVNVESLLKNLDSNELKELKQRFNDQFRSNMHNLREAEIIEVRQFIDGLSLDRGWYDSQRDAVSLSRYNLPIEQRRKLNEISDAISRGFRDLGELKTEVAREAKRNGTPYSKVFTTTVRRMNRYQGNYS